MKTSDWIRFLAVTALLASACGTSPTVATAPSPSPSALASPTASPTPASSPCPPPSNRCLALVTLRRSSSYVVRDLTDINHPKTLSNLGAISGPVFVSGTEISYANDTGLFRMPLSGSPKTLVVKHGGAGTWSPDGTAVVFMTSTSTDPYSGTTTIHQLKAGHDQVLGSMPNGGAGGCEYVASCTLPNWLDSQLAYSPDGAYISLVHEGFSGSVFRIWSSAGNLLKSNDGQGATMSTWSGRGLYFRDAKGVEVWQDGVVSSFLPGVVWVKPKGSSDGTQIVFTVRDRSGWGHIRVVDTTTRQVRELKSARTDARFLTSRYIWYEGERACVADDICGLHPPFHPLNDKTYIYDLQTGAESESIITSVADVWPDPA